MKRLLATCLLMAALVACSANYDPGPDGKVTGRSATYRKVDGWTWTLTVDDGKPFRVTQDEYKSCFHGSTYPDCATRGDS